MTRIASLTTSDHRRDIAGRRYVYPVVSRRAGGVSIGINLNTNNACNWRCLYCQVPGLIRGAAPEVSLDLLEQELRAMLQEVTRGSFMRDHVPEGMRRINDIAFSGNGEPTSARQFDQVVERVASVIRDYPLPRELKLVLITNGSLVDRTEVQDGLRHMSAANGEVWFKLDSATRAGMARINNTRISLARVRRNLEIAAGLCPTWLQTCVFCLDEEPPSRAERDAYLAFVAQALQAGVRLQGVLLYGLARQSMQPEARRLSRVPPGWGEAFATEIGSLGLPVRWSP